MPPRIDDPTRAAILADIDAKVGSTRVIAARHGVSEFTVRKIAKDAGRVDAFSREQTEKATRARTIDLAAQRAELKAELLADAERLRLRAWAPYSYYERGPDGPELVTLALPPLRETREAYTALGIALDKHLKLDAHDQGDTSAAARTLIGDLARGLDAAYQAMGKEDGGDAS